MRTLMKPTRRLLMSLAPPHRTNSLHISQASSIGQHLLSSLAASDGKLWAVLQYSDSVKDCPGSRNSRFRSGPRLTTISCRAQLLGAVWVSRSPSKSIKYWKPWCPVWSQRLTSNQVLEGPQVLRCESGPGAVLHGADQRCSVFYNPGDYLR